MRSLLLRLMKRVRGYRDGVSDSPDVHMKLAQAFTECPGQWVAVDRRTGRVVAARPNPYELSAYVKERQITGVEIFRAPAVGEPEVVGIG